MPDWRHAMFAGLPGMSDPGVGDHTFDSVLLHGLEPYVGLGSASMNPGHGGVPAAAASATSADAVRGVRAVVAFERGSGAYKGLGSDEGAVG